jgi:glucose-6-phosphate isomerase
VSAAPPGRDSVRVTDAQARAINERLRWAHDTDLLARVWAREDALWGPGEDPPSERLGWLTIAEHSLTELDAVEDFARALQAEGFSDCALLGMGGSSLAPEVLWQTFGASGVPEPTTWPAEAGPPPELGRLRLHVLDSTHPRAIAELERRLPLERTLFLISSKSGGTLEPRSMHACFHARVPDGRQWAAVTDPGTSLEALAREQGFREVFHGAPDVGGRYSALSAFGVVPGVLIGAPMRALLERAEAAVRSARVATEPEHVRAARLGLALGALAREGRDKLTLVVDAPLRALGLWLEQLVAESTGKQGVGIVPVADEPLAAPAAYGEDRLFVHVCNTRRSDDVTRRRLDALGAAGHPVLPVTFAEPADLGALLLDWELAIAIAGAVLEINPFDQPNVQEAKDLTLATIEAYVRDGRFPEQDAQAVAVEDAAGALGELLGHARAGSYVATMAYLPPDAALDAALTRLRTAIRDRTRAATTVGYGPRFLHSTGQLHKGGPPSGVFLQLVDDGRPQVEIPGAGYDFGALVRAQAIGDGDALRRRGLPFLRVHVGEDAAAGVTALAATLEEVRG